MKNILILKSMRWTTLSPVAKLNSVYIVICRVIQTDRVSQIPGNTDTDTVMQNSVHFRNYAILVVAINLLH